MLPNSATGRKITRREFLRLSTATAAGSILLNLSQRNALNTVQAASPANYGAQLPAPAIPATPQGTYKEAPMLAKLVQKGMLPPVDLRLPANPCVLPALENVRRYDALINRAYKGITDRWGPTKMIDHAIAWYDQNLDLVPRQCESWEINADGSEWTFHFRPGMRWSDGVEFTTDEILWWYEYGLKDPRITISIPYLWQTGGQLMTVEAINKNTIKMIFSHPKALFLYELARDSGGFFSCLCPSHYLKQYHIDFTSDPAALQAEAAAAGYSDWITYLVNNRSYWYLNPERPVLGPWVAKNQLGQSLFVMERNPYYFCVDSAQNQLPYNDTIIHRNFTLSTEFNAWVKSGMIDFQARHVSYSDYVEFIANQTIGDYRVIVGSGAGHLAIQLNLTTKDLRLRAFFQNRNIRIALSLAVNRTAINNLVYNGLATPRQYSPISSSPQYYSQLSNAYIAFDINQANSLLDQAGYTEKDALGYRLWNDGSNQRISFTIESFFGIGTAEEIAVQQVIQYYAVVGIEAVHQFVDRSTFVNHINTNQIEAAWNGGDRTIIPIAPEAPIFRGILSDRPWACAWTLWWNNPADPNAEEPPTDHWIRTIWSIWEQIIIQPNENQRRLLFKQILDIWATELPMIGYLGEIPALAIAKNNFHNFITGFPMDDTTADEEVYNPETYAWDNILNASLTINFQDGKPGSFFTIVGTNYPHYSTALVSINGQAIDTLFTDATGRVEFVLDTSQADIGFYEVTVQVNPTASTTFKLSNNGVQHPAESATMKLIVPSGIANNSTFIPMIRR